MSLDEVELVTQKVDRDQTLFEILSYASDKASDRNVPVAWKNPQPAASSSTAANSVIPHDSSLLNFVDASILSKLKLPSSDSRLVDYPEF
ncbi:hypothetical protein KIN20_012922 [Parelaphostrongylus tenuis]|uniref:Uncharacterized protein n=1 Tax=Parelaphostrongylus tenuis TaxID=148309 RepID=A0AAD5MBB7_PARTN|nr:hypothetical protein KIN20_012922 [Parelaphostrongylus tenuis]